MKFGEPVSEVVPEQLRQTGCSSHEHEILLRADRLPGDARRVVLPRAIGEGRLAEIGHVGQRVRVARVLVVEHVQRVLPLPCTRTLK